MATNDPVTSAVSSPVVEPVSPKMRSGGHLKATTPSSGSGFTAFASQLASRVVLVNTTGDVVEVQQDASGEVLPIPDGSFMEFYGIDNVDQLAVRKKTAGAVDVYARWEK